MIYKFPQLETAFIIPRKVASSAIRAALGQAVGEYGQKWGWKYKTTLECLEGYRIIGFVRNPYDRLVSCYKNQCLGEDRFKLGQCSFEEFVNYVTWTPYDLADKHFLGQWGIMRDIPDRIIKYENLEEEWPSLGLPNLPKLNVSEGPDVEWTHEMREKVFRYYRKDFEVYGYVSQC